MEGINLFLAGEFPGCVFIIGMDAEMIAAALEVAHSSVIRRLPKYSAHMPIGWRFMDKFIQLPIAIPPAIEENLKKYAASLLSEYNTRDTTISKPPTKDSDEPLDSDTVIGDNKSENKDQGKADDVSRQKIAEVSQKMDEISDKDKVSSEQISKAISYFSNNPREIKRFVNALRFQRFLMTNMTNKGSPSLDQVRRWIILSLKWPQVVRWLYWSANGRNDSGKNNKDNTRERLNFWRIMHPKIKRIGLKNYG